MTKILNMSSENKSVNRWQMSVDREQSVDKRIAIFFITEGGQKLARKIAEFYSDSHIMKFNSSGAAHEIPLLWQSAQSLVFVMALGIVVRAIAPYLKDKKTDPAVVVLDEKGQFVISLLSGHLGGANALAQEIAAHLGAQAVITTASDVLGKVALDVWAAENNLYVEDYEKLKRLSARIVNGERIKVHTECLFHPGRMPDEFVLAGPEETPDLIITSNVTDGDILTLRPKNLFMGIGCNRGTSKEEIKEMAAQVLEDEKLSTNSLHCAASIDLKKDETGLIDFADDEGLQLEFFTRDELNSAVSDYGINPSEAVMAATGAAAVAEPAAILAAKKRFQSSTKKEKGERNISDRKGRIYVVGIGPGGSDHITPAAQKAIRDADVIVGYKTYLDLIQSLIKDKEIMSSGMRQEVDRCSRAVDIAAEGKAVAVICSGDPGIYAMAGLVFEVLSGQESAVSGQEIYVEVIPGIPALSACAMHDFASISLSDLLTPWEVIIKRLEAAASADFVIVIYNPKSKGRPDNIDKARDIIMKYRPETTPVGIVKAATRSNETIVITDLKNMLDQEIDMQSTVIIGNSQTFLWNKRMVTPRGYGNKYKI